jgi:heterogeneous nuclear ribonucleoprotein R
MKDKETKENKGFAFVTFTGKDGAQRAIEDLHDKEHKVLWLSGLPQRF